MNIIKKIPLALLLFFTITSLKAQKVQEVRDSLKFNQLIVKTDSLFKASNYKRGIIELKEYLFLYKKSEDWDVLAKIYNKISEGYLKLSNDKLAKANIDSSLRIYEYKLKELVITKAQTYSNLALYLRYNGMLDSAFIKYNEALEIRKKLLPRFDKEIGKNYLDIIPVLAIKGDFEKALLYTDSLKIVCDKNKKDNESNLIEYYVNLGRINSILSRNNIAIEAGENALKTLSNLSKKSEKKHAELLLELCYIYYNAKDLGKALGYALKALPVYQSFVDENDIKMFNVYNNISRIYARLGEHIKALNYNDKALKIAKSAHGNKALTVSQGYEARALIFSLMGKNYSEEAIDNYKKSVAIIKDLLGGSYKDLIYIYGNIGENYEKLGLLDEAAEYLEKSLTIGQKIFGNDNVLIVPTLQNLAIVQIRNGHKKKAFYNLDKALSLEQKTHGEEHWEIGLVYLTYGHVFMELNEFDKASEYFNKILKIYDERYKLVIQEKYDIAPFYEVKNMFDAILGLAKAKKKKYEFTKNIELLKASAFEYEKAHVLSMKMRQKITSDNDRLALGEINKEFFDGAIETHSLLFEKTQIFSNLEKLLYYSERSRASALSENVRPKLNNQIKGLSAALELEKNLRLERATYLTKIKKEEDNNFNNDSIAKFKNGLFQVNSKYDSLMYWIKQEKPAYFQVNFDDANVKISKIQEDLNVNTAILEFFEHQDGTVFCVLISKNNASVKVYEIQNLKEKISNFNVAIEEKNTPVFKKIALQLYEELLMATLKGVNVSDLIIIPDGSLWGLEFDMLLTNSTETNNPKELPYLLRDYSISYANSIELLQSYKKEVVEANKECLAFSYTNFNDSQDGSSLNLVRLRDISSDLPGTRKEIREIARIVDGKYYYGSKAIESNFKEEASDFSILHLALHGEVNHNKPEYSRLFFTQEQDSVEDNYLYTHELINLNLPAKLAVLSACNTGVGKNLVGEGVMSLGAAFQYAGTKSLLLSKWEVSDAVTPEIMKYFYQNLKAGMTKSRALQQAKLTYLDSSEGIYSHPYYWGSFYILGDNEALSLSAKTTWQIYFFIVLVVVLIGFLYKKYKISEK